MLSSAIATGKRNRPPKDEIVVLVSCKSREEHSRSRCARPRFWKLGGPPAGMLSYSETVGALPLNYNYSVPQEQQRDRCEMKVAGNIPD